MLANTAPFGDAPRRAPRQRTWFAEQIRRSQPDPRQPRHRTTGTGRKPLGAAPTWTLTRTFCRNWSTNQRI